VRAAGLSVLLAAALTGCVSGPVGNARPPEPVRAVALDRYLGKWYELARYDMAFERGCEAVTAEYSLRPDGLVKVVNSCHKGTPDGPLAVAVGRAKRVGDPLGARLKVSFFGPFFADYWVLDHGPDYEWSIVGEGSGRYLWILSRDPHPPQAVRDDLVRRVKAMGYDLKLLRITRQK
jgi:apolipoprotein D and lipocalin family protein